MRRYQWLGGWGLAAVMFTSPANAGWNEFWARCHLDYHRNAAFPEPFATADRQIVRQHFEVTEANGWRLQNTVGDFLFDKDTHALNTAGERKIQWILRNAPEHRRQVFVLRAENQALTQQRFESVQQYLTLACEGGAIPPVFLTDHDVAGLPGEYSNEIEKQYWKTVPSPRLPADTSGQSSSGSSGGGS